MSIDDPDYKPQQDEYQTIYDPKPDTDSAAINQSDRRVARRVAELAAHPMIEIPASIASLTTALSKAQAEMKGASKDGWNDFSNYNYVTLASVYKAIDEALAKQGVFHSQAIHTEENRVGVELRVSLGSQEIRTPILWLPFDIAKGRSTVQAMGSAITYGRKYQLMAFFGIPQEDDDGVDAGTPPKAKANPKDRVKQAIKKKTEPKPSNLTKTGNLVQIGLGPAGPDITETAKDGDIWINWGKDPAIVYRFDGELWDPIKPGEAPYLSAHETAGIMLKELAKRDSVPPKELFEMLRVADDADVGAKTFGEVSVYAICHVLAELECPL